MRKGKKLELRSDEIKDMLLQSPTILINYGIVFIFIIFTTVVSITFFIRYPDKVISDAIITSTRGTLILPVENSGRINFLVKNNMHVKNGATIAYIEQPNFDINSYYKLQSVLSQNQLITEEIQNLGPLKEIYERCRLNSRDLYFLDSISYFDQIKLITARIKILEDRISSKKKQVEYIKLEFALLKKSFQRDSILFESTVISSKDWEDAQISYYEFNERFQEEVGNKLSIKAEVYFLEEQKSILKKEWQEKKLSVIKEVKLSRKELSNATESFEKNYIVIAGIDGTTNFFEKRNNEYVEKGEKILAIIPNKNNTDFMIATCIIDQENITKVKQQQNVIIRVIGYPEHEFGTILGIVENISSVPKNKKYTVEVSLPNPLKTNRGFYLNFSNVISCEVEIITQDLTLAERLLNKVREVII